jgi:hypothetical protein
MDAATIHKCCCGLDGKITHASRAIARSSLCVLFGRVKNQVKLKFALMFIVLRPFALLGAGLGVVVYILCALALALWGVVLCIQGMPSLAILVLIGAGAIFALAIFESHVLIRHRRELHLLFACITITTFVCLAHSAFATVMSQPIGSHKHDFGDGVVENVWSLLPSPMVSDIQDRYGCCGYTYADPLEESVEVDEFGRLWKSTKGSARHLVLEGDDAESEDVPCPLHRTSRSCSPVPGLFAENTASNGTSWSQVYVPASCRAELQCRNEDGWLWSHHAPGYLIAVVAAALHVLCFVVLLVSKTEEHEDVEVLMIRERWQQSKMSREDWETATIGALRMQCAWRGFVERRRIFYRREYLRWESNNMQCTRRILSGVTYSILITYIIFMTYICLIYGIKFSNDQSSLWITSTAWAMMIEIFIQEPLLIISSTVVFSGQMVGHIGDLITAALGM